MFGGRNWTIFTASVLFIPTIAPAYFVTTRHALFNNAARLGTGGIRLRQFCLEHGEYLFLLSRPHERLGAWSQRSRRGIHIQNAGLMWLPPLAIAVYGAFFYMSDLVTARSTFKDQLAIVGRKHTWITSFIYIGTFSSFIGYSAAFPPLIKTLYPAVTIGIAFLRAGRFAVATARRLAGRQGTRRNPSR
jgi:MFS transporter, NNP family, nitrate/nitrite transporter